MNLGGKKVDKKSKKAEEPQAKKQRQKNPKKAAAVPEKPKAKSSVKAPRPAEQDERIRPGDAVGGQEVASPKQGPKAAPVLPFTDGLVNRVFEKAVPATIRRPAEEALFEIGAQDLIRESATFVGDVSVRTSFVTHKKEGGMLL